MAYCYVYLLPPDFVERVLKQITDVELDINGKPWNIFAKGCDILVMRTTAFYATANDNLTAASIL